MASAKTWVMTWNNYPDDAWEAVQAFAHEFCNRATVGREVAPTTGTPHLQGAFGFKKTWRLGGLQKALGKGIYFAVAVTKDPFTYCGKDDKEPFVLDVREPGKRSDLEPLYKRLREGVTWADLGKEDLKAQHWGIAEKYKKHCGTKRVHGPREILWYWGESGSGKTRAAYEFDEDLLSIQAAPGGRVWFDGYENQKTILFDDLRPDSIKFDKLLRLLDRYTQQEEIKGGHVWANYDNVIITSIIRPEDWPCDGTGITQLLRRLTVTREFKNE